MMVTVELSPEREMQLRGFAESNQMSIEQALLKASEYLVPTQSAAHLQKTDLDAWHRRVDEWLASHAQNTVVLSDEAMSRESIYPDRA